MKKTLLASLAVAAVLASCTKESVVDSTIEAATSSNVITFSTYASSATKGTAVETNSAFQGTGSDYKSFYVAATFDPNEADNTAGSYFGFSQVTYGGSGWDNKNDMYWPNEDGALKFGAIYPNNIAGATYTYTDAASTLSFAYTVTGNTYASGSSAATDISGHEDIMYAITEETFAVANAGSEDNVNLHFKHALSQIAFTATKDSDLEVTVSAIQLCNVYDGGTFSATKSTETSANVMAETDKTIVVDDANVVMTDFSTSNNWDVSDGVMTHYTPTFYTDSAYDTDNSTNAGSPSTTYRTVSSDSDAVALTSPTDVMMLIPQTLTGWVKGTDGSSTGTESFLAITCTIKHAGADAAIVDGILYVPFSAEWEPGYKYTYNLVFGGGYTIPGGDEDDIPEPGETPEDNEVVETLRAITYTVTIDEWVPVASTDVTM